MGMFCCTVLQLSTSPLALHQIASNCFSHCHRWITLLKCHRPGRGRIVVKRFQTVPLVLTLAFTHLVIISTSLMVISSKYQLSCCQCWMQNMQHGDIIYGPSRSALGVSVTARRLSLLNMFNAYKCQSSLSESCSIVSDWRYSGKLLWGLQLLFPYNSPQRVGETERHG